jgi:hypothetical protein
MNSVTALMTSHNTAGKVADFGLSRATTVGGDGASGGGGDAGLMEEGGAVDEEEGCYRSQHGVFPVRLLLHNGFFHRS